MYEKTSSVAPVRNTPVRDAPAVALGGMVEASMSSMVTKARDVLGLVDEVERRLFGAAVPEAKKGVDPPLGPGIWSCFAGNSDVVHANLDEAAKKLASIVERL